MSVNQLANLYRRLANFFPATAGTPAGEWTLTDTIEESSVAAYVGTMVTFRLRVTANGQQVSGNGLKIMANGKAVTPNERSHLQITGVLNGRKLTADFTEEIAGRKNIGRFWWLFSEDFRTFTGSFDSTAANTKGRSQGHKTEM